MGIFRGDHGFIRKGGMQASSIQKEQVAPHFPEELTEKAIRA